MRRFFSKHLPSKGANIQLEREVSHHILRVVGVAPNEEFELFDGNRQGCVALLVSVVQSKATVMFIRSLPSEKHTSPLWMVLALTKGDAFSTAIRMLTEVGVSHIIPFRAHRSIAKGCKVERWNKIAHSSAAQSKQLSVPKVYPLQNFDTALRMVESVSKRFVLTPNADEFLGSNVGEAAVLIGPEGGFTTEELSVCDIQGWSRRKIDTPVRRADTAAIVAASRVLF